CVSELKSDRPLLGASGIALSPLSQEIVRSQRRLARRLRTILAAIVRSSAARNRGPRRGGADPYEGAAPGWERGESWFTSGGARFALASQPWLLGFPSSPWAATELPRPLLDCGPSLDSFQFSKRCARRVSITVRRSCAWRAWGRGLLSNLQSRRLSHRRQRATTILSASVFSSTKNSLHSTSALRARTSLRQRRGQARVTESTTHPCHYLAL